MPVTISVANTVDSGGSGNSNDVRCLSCYRVDVMKFHIKHVLRQENS
jgi:hypothetical protein